MTPRSKRHWTPLKPSKRRRSDDPPLSNLGIDSDMLLGKPKNLSNPEKKFPTFVRLRKNYRAKDLQFRRNAKRVAGRRKEREGEREERKGGDQGNELADERTLGEIGNSQRETTGRTKRGRRSKSGKSPVEEKEREREKRNYVCAEIMVELDDTSMSISSSSFLLLLFFPFLSLSRPSEREKEGQ